ncbi:MAG: hypothetical protein A2900_03490 [Candidatus Chisholmbacteria bacterium RIFCSPLOWO2_01_FULL_50_28]|uniref:Uncharacterized protein n=1 Tax=Candidatus Chisholmbacteria bacterium RIFCSPHIGHO2_01_FULL_52_32 TaxID=1797591 RepID=A0A1G1VSW6_9BACT|nr:MAG: hypothetical protein A2786_03255 [Candidatus Chisholmbacteria bacterium RIFCSPHIGHO2_01_FULL_52_32]OGY20140.1 MAG: hypothetical protein A2900_03490 [Candidatus Chisholmbacteria bacterium RIFCSPLOWO2_01_FULL_50_28]
MTWLESRPLGAEAGAEDTQYIDRAVEATWPIVHESGIAKTEWGKAGLWYAVTQATLLRSALRRPTLLRQSGVLEKTGGPSYNPAREIDAVGNKVIHSIMRRIQVPALVYIEEEERWLSFNSEMPGIPVTIAVDPLDETGPIRIGLRVQTAAVTIANQRGEFVAGTIASLVDDEICLIEDNEAHLLSFYESSPEFAQRSPLQELVINPPPFRDIEKARIATLPRRMDQLRRIPAFQNLDWLPTFGGYGLLGVIRGDIDVMLDPLKGQPWYEAVEWGSMAEKAGLIVSDAEGNSIDFQNIMLRAMHGEKLERVKIVISRDQHLHDQILSGLQVGLQEAVAV